MQDKKKFFSTLILCAVLAVITFTVFFQLLGSDFIGIDDSTYIVRNPNVRNGITVSSIKWAVKYWYAATGGLLTWLSHMLDCNLYGLNARGHHLTSLLLHMFSTILLFLAMGKMTGCRLRSGFVALLFAIHPLHVESVSWIAERKDTLSGFFWFLSMLAYARYAQKPNVKRYLLVFASAALGLMSKPTVVTLPLALLILDYWPLGRINSKEFPLKKAIIEKIPLLVLSVAASAGTYLAQKKIGAIAVYPLSLRLQNAAVSYAEYLEKTFWPSKLAVFYPYHSKGFALWVVVLSAVLLVLITALAIKARKKHPYLLAGWAWYLIVLVPMIGIVQAGSHAMADRHTYIPLVGVFIAAAWILPNLLGRASKIIAVSIVVVLAAISWVQVGHWKGPVPLYEHAVKVTNDNYFIYVNLGSELMKAGRLDEAEQYFRKALQVKPEFVECRRNLGLVLAAKGEYGEAIKEFRTAVGQNPKYTLLRFNLAAALALDGRDEESAKQLETVLEEEPGMAKDFEDFIYQKYRGGETEAAWRFVGIMRRAGAEPDPSLIQEMYAPKE